MGAAGFCWGGIIAAQIEAALRLRSEGIAAGLLFVVGEEGDSQRKSPTCILAGRGF